MKLAFHITVALLAILPAQAADRCPTAYMPVNAESFRPGVRVSSPDIPVEFENGRGMLITGSEGSSHLIPTSFSPAGTSFYLPPHPDRPWEGGDVEITLMNKDDACPGIRVHLEPLERAPGTLQKALTLIKMRMDAELKMLGTDFQTVSDSAYEPQSRLLATYHELAIAVLDADNPDSIKSTLADYKSSPDADTRAEFEMLEALLAASGVIDRMSIDTVSRVQALETLKTTLEKPISFAPDSDDATYFQHLGFDGSAPDLLLARLDPPKKEKATYGKGMIETPEELSRVIWLQHEAVAGLEPDVQIFRDAAGSLLTAASALAEGGGNKLVSKGYDAASALLFVWTTFDKIVLGLYPNSLTDLKIDISHEEIFLEDDPREGLIKGIWVTPEAQGLDIGKLGLDFVLQVLPVGDLAALRTGSAARFAKSRPTGLRAAEMYKLRAFNRALNKRTRNDAYVKGVLDTSKFTVLGKLIESLPDLSKIPPFKFPPVNIYTGTYANVKLSRNDIIAIGFVSERSAPYSALALGTATIKASTMPGKFATSHAEGSVDVVVRDSYGLKVLPERAFVTPGETVHFEVVWAGPDDMIPDFELAYDSDQKGHDFRLAKAPHEIDYLNQTKLAYSLDVTTLSNVQKFPVNIDVWIKSRPEKRASASIAAPAIMPSKACVDAGEELQLEILVPSDVKGFKPQWKVLRGGGSINATGHYRAPANAASKSKVVIEARLSPTVALQSEITLNCGCSWSLEALGQRWGGRDITVMNVRDPGKPQSHVVMVHDADDISISLASPNEMLAGSRAGSLVATVKDEALATYCNGDDNQDGKCDPPSPSQVNNVPTPASYVIHRVGPKFVEGSISGLAQHVSQRPTTGKIPTTPVTLNFRAARTDINIESDPSIALARQMAKQFGVDDEALSQFDQLSGMMGVNACSAEN